MRILYYALGGGHGHVARGLAVLKQLGTGTLIGPGRLSSWANDLGISYLTPPTKGWAAWLDSLETPDLLLVDVFPLGVAGEIRPLLSRSPAWLISRWVKPTNYLASSHRAVLESSYERIIWSEPPHPVLSKLEVPQRRIPPILLNEPPLSRADARKVLGIEDEERLILGIGTGPEKQQQNLVRLLMKIAIRLDATVRFISDRLPRDLIVRRWFPAASLLSGADVVVGSGGYHTVYETLAAGVPTVYISQERRLDDQALRVADLPMARSPIELEEKLWDALTFGEWSPLVYGDGTLELARLVKSRVKQGIFSQEHVAPVTGGEMLVVPEITPDRL